MAICKKCKSEIEPTLDILETRGGKHVFMKCPECQAVTKVSYAEVQHLYESVEEPVTEVNQPQAEPQGQDPEEPLYPEPIGIINRVRLKSGDIEVCIDSNEAFLLDVNQLAMENMDLLLSVKNMENPTDIMDEEPEHVTDPEPMTKQEDSTYTKIMDSIDKEEAAIEPKKLTLFERIRGKGMIPEEAGATEKEEPLNEESLLDDDSKLETIGKIEPAKE